MWWHVVAYRALLLPVRSDRGQDPGEDDRRLGRTRATTDAMAAIFNYFERREESWTLDRENVAQLAEAVKRGGESVSGGVGSAPPCSGSA